MVLTLLFSATASFSLPACKGSYNASTWTNCFGTYSDGKGFKYVGEFKNGAYSGQGAYTISAPSSGAGYKYVGGFKDNKRNGQGIDTYSEPHSRAGFTYVGEQKDGNQDGQGTGTYSTPHKFAGYKYLGEYRESKRHGQGIAIYANGTKYVGKWEAGKKHGQGKLTEKNGTVKEGLWKEGELQYAQKADETNKQEINNLGNELNMTLARVASLERKNQILKSENEKLSDELKRLATNIDPTDIDAVVACAADPSKCKINLLCEKATKEVNGQTVWNDAAESYVAYAKNYELTCGVNATTSNNVIKKNLGASLFSLVDDVEFIPYPGGIALEDSKVYIDSDVGFFLFSMNYIWFDKVLESLNPGSTKEAYKVRYAIKLHSIDDSTANMEDYNWKYSKKVNIVDYKGQTFLAVFNADIMKIDWDKASEAITFAVTTDSAWAAETFAIDFASSRNLSTNLSKKTKNCSTKTLKSCSKEELCQKATLFPNGAFGTRPFVREAQARGLNCTVNSQNTSNLPNCPPDQTKRYHNCFGTITLQNGSKYIGDFRDAKRHGTGTQIYSSGAIYKGEWENGKRNGYGSFKLKTALTNISQAGLWKDGVFQD